MLNLYLHLYQCDTDTVIPNEVRNLFCSYRILRQAQDDESEDPHKMAKVLKQVQDDT